MRGRSPRRDVRLPSSWTASRSIQVLRRGHKPGKKPFFALGFSLRFGDLFGALSALMPLRHMSPKGNPPKTGLGYGWGKQQRVLRRLVVVEMLARGELRQPLGRCGVLGRFAGQRG